MDSNVPSDIKKVTVVDGFNLSCSIMHQSRRVICMHKSLAGIVSYASNMSGVKDMALAAEFLRPWHMVVSADHLRLAVP